jgi:hypothetical protein
MPRGSKPGERRGGRQRATPNRRTVLTNRILAAAANPAPNADELVLVLAKDQALPADTRMAIARKALLLGPSRSMHSRSAASNGNGRPPSKPLTKAGPDRETNNKGYIQGGRSDSNKRRLSDRSAACHRAGSRRECCGSSQGSLANRRIFPPKGRQRKETTSRQIPS